MDIDYDADLDDKLAKNQQLWEMLAPQAEAGAEFNLDFFFYSDTKEAAQSLVEALSDLGHVATSEKRGSILKRVWLVRGTTDPMPLTKAGIDNWTHQMVAVSRRSGAYFDGWGAALPT